MTRVFRPDWLKLDPFVSSALEAKPPFAFETAEKGAPLMDGGGDVGVARMD
jgi:hypothetical protein